MAYWGLALTAWGNPFAAGIGLEAARMLRAEGAAVAIASTSGSGIGVREPAS